MDNKEIVVSAEELAAEQEASNLPKEEEIRSKVIEDFGFDPEKDKEKIEKAVSRETDHRKKLSDAIGQKIKYREVAKTIKKPEVEVKKLEENQNKEPVMSVQDQRALIKADIPEEDVSDVEEYAKFKKISIVEALKSPILIATLKDKSEKRATAEATNVRTVRRQTQKVDGDTLVKNLEKGEVPEKGSQEAEDLFWAKRGGRR